MFCPVLNKEITKEECQEIRNSGNCNDDCDDFIAMMVAMKELEMSDFWPQ